MRRYLPGIALVAIVVLQRPAHAAPVVLTQVTPSAAPTDGGVRLTLSGSGFGLAPTVTVGVNACPVVSASDGAIVCTLPAGQGKNLQVKVVAAPLEVSNALPFSYLPPSISSLAPAAGGVAGGTLLNVSGANFGSSPQVTIGGKPCALSGPATHTALSCVTPAGSGPQPVVVTVEGQESAPVPFAYLAVPVITSIAPSSGAAVGGNPVTISGTDLGPAPTVTIGGNLCGVTASSTASVTCTAPPGSGPQAVVVTVAGRASVPATYTYAAAPIISSLNPTGGPTAGGTPITIAGTALGPNPSVTLDGKACVVTSSAPLVCISPPGQGANRPLVVTVATVASTPVFFSYNPPVVTGVTPASGAAKGGTEITISGANFGTAPTVRIGDSACAVSSHADGRIVCVTPAGAAGKAVLTVSAGEQSGTSVFSYR